MVDILRRKKNVILKIDQLVAYQTRKRFMQEVWIKSVPKASSRPLFNFGKSAQNSQCEWVTLLKERIFETGFLKKTSKS